MKHTREEILDALKVIMETCEEFDKCKRCPLYSTDSEMCGIQNMDPENWELSTGETFWRAFV